MFVYAKLTVFYGSKRSFMIHNMFWFLLFLNLIITTFPS